MTHGTGRPPRLAAIFHQHDAPVFFITIYTINRLPLLANDIVHTALREFAERGHRERNIAVGRYVLMPDHLHLFVCGPTEFDLSQWVRMLKRKLIPEPNRWQRGFFDHLLRNDESYNQKWEYVRKNPVRAGLVMRAEEWPYQGEIVEIDRA